MTPQTLMLIEATGIQNYIFGSNQLRQNIGASELVHQVTTGWVSRALPAPHNFSDSLHITDETIHDDGTAAEVIYAGGGKAAILFQNEEKALDFSRRYTRCALKEAPGLELVIRRRPFNPERDSFEECYQKLRQELQRRKQHRQFSIPLQGLGVTAKCVFSGAPAVDFRDEHLVSAEVRAKLDAELHGKARLKEMFPQVERDEYELTYDFNDFGTKGESSYIAVIHADCNNMGKRIHELGKRYPGPKNNRAYILALRRFSKSVQVAAEEALEKTVGMLLHPDNLNVPSYSDSQSEKKIGGIVPIPVRGDQRFLPFRPIVFGGDDATFVSEGRLGLALAAEYLTQLQARELSDGRPVDARAGVAVVKSHYPFSRAYELAEALCRSAKVSINKWEEGGESGISALDWHFATTGLVLPLQEVREREYTCRSGSLLMRPVSLKSVQGDWRSWETFGRLSEEFRKEDEEWEGRRNKIKALREALREGPESTASFLRGIRNKQLPDIPQRRDMKAQGWHSGECGYYDVVESLDFYVSLRKEGGMP